MSKPKKPVRTTQEIIADELRAKEIRRKRAIIVDKFYPNLIKATVSVEEAKSLVSAMTQLIYGEAMKVMRTMKMSDIKEELIKVLCQDGQRTEEIKELIDSLGDETLFTSRGLIEGMTGALNKAQQEYMQKKNLVDLPMDWDKYLNG